MTWRIAFPIVLVLALLTAGKAWAQTPPPDVVSRPHGQVATWKAAASEDAAYTLTQRICLFVVGTDYLDAASHVACGPTEQTPGAIAEGTVTIPIGQGDAVYRAVAISATGQISEPSENTLTVPDLPGVPFFVTGGS